jgi:hypothetical protein
MSVDMQVDGALLRKQGLDFLGLGLLAFLVLGLEVPLALFLEPLMYGMQMAEWNTAQNISHWVVTCIMWGLCAFMLCFYAAKRLDFEILAQRRRLEARNWIACLVVAVVLVAFMTINWGGFKPALEFASRGPLLFAFQYLYYIVEAALVFLIVAFGQQAGVRLFANTMVPWGGILAGLTWGLVHIMTQGSVEAGLLTGLNGVLYGVIYVAARGNTPVAYLLIMLAFVL